MSQWQVQRRHLCKVHAKAFHAWPLLWDTLKTSPNEHPNFPIIPLVIWEPIIHNGRDIPFMDYPAEWQLISENLEICVNRLTSGLMNNNLPQPMYIQMPKYHTLLLVYSQICLVIQVMHIEWKRQCSRGEHM